MVLTLVRRAALACALTTPLLLPAQATKDTTTKAPLPLAVGRTSTFTTTEGSWMSVDVSPDGRTLVFDLLGQLYTMPSTGGPATPLTSGMAFNAQPRFSPDGKRIVFVSDRSGGENLWIMSLDRRDTLQLTKGNEQLYHSPEWTPDGRYIVASRSGGPLGGAAKLWLYHVEGGNGLPLISEPATLKTLGAAFGPDAQRVYYAQRTGDWQYNAIFPQYQLAVYDRERGQSTVITTRYGSAFRPALSPDGKWLVYGTRHDAESGLRIRDLATGEERWLAYPVQRDDQESRAPLDVMPGYSFTPDSRFVVASYNGGFWRIPIAGGTPTPIPFTAEVSLAIGPEVTSRYTVDDGTTFTARQIRDAQLSPDGKRLAFSALAKLYVMDWPSGTPRRLTTQAVGEYQPSWSPDGSMIAFVTWDDANGGQVMTVPAAGGRATAVSNAAAYYQAPAWSPDGTRLVSVRAPARELREALGFFSTITPTAEFVWFPRAGGAATVITPANGRYAPHFTTDASRIYAYSPATGLVSFRWDGTDEKTHLKVTGPLPPARNWVDDHHGPDMPAILGSEANPTPPPAAVIRMAPRGDLALAQVGMDLYTVTVPQVGTTAPTVSVANPATASVPVRQLNEIGGEFPSWSADGRRVLWSLGNAVWSYDLDRAKVVDDSLAAAKKAAATAKSDSAAKPDSASRAPKGYLPDERRVAVTATRDLPTGTLVLRNARLITMKGTEVIERGDLVIRGHRIAAVGPSGSVAIPDGAEVRDLAGATIVPGFVDTHYHPQWLVPAVHTGQVWQYLATLAYGVTTTRDPQTATTDVLTYQDRVETGDLVGPRIYSTGPGVFANEAIKDLDHARRVLKRYATYYDTKTLKMYMSGNRQQRQWIIMAAKELGIMPTTEGGLDFKLDLTHAIDGYPGIEHALPIAPLFGDVARLLIESGTTNSPTLLVSYGGPFGEEWWYTRENPYRDAKLRTFTPEAELDAKTRRRGQGVGAGPGGWFRDEEFVFPKHAAFAKRVVEAGGRMGVGAHGQLQGLGYQWELWSMAAGGMTPHDALRTATILGAEAIGFGDDLGSLEPGKLADLVVLGGNPLANLRETNNIRFVMKGGRMYDAGTLAEVFPRQRPLPPQPWQDLGPR